MTSFSFVVAQPADQIDEVALAAADFDHSLVPNIVFLNKPFRHAGYELDKGRGKTLLILITLRKIVQRSIERAVENQPATVAARQNNIFARYFDRLFVALHRGEAIDGRIRDRKEIFKICVITGWAGRVLHFTLVPSSQELKLLMSKSGRSRSFSDTDVASTGHSIPNTGSS